MSKKNGIDFVWTMRVVIWRNYSLYLFIYVDDYILGVRILCNVVVVVKMQCCFVQLLLNLFKKVLDKYFILFRGIYLKATSYTLEYTDFPPWFRHRVN